MKKSERSVTGSSRDRARTESGGAQPAPGPKPLSSRNGLRDAGAFLLLLGITIAVYMPALNGGLVWDDNMHVTRTELQSLEGLWRIWFDLGATQQYYPLLHSAFWLEHRLWGDAVLGYHLVNVVLHAISAFLVAKIAQRLGMAGAWLAGLLFTVHPVCVEGVAWISEQKSTLSGAFCLGAALTYVKFDSTRRRSLYLSALGLFVLGLLSKTVIAVLPAALLVIFWWRRGEIAWKRDVKPLSLWFAIGIPAGLFTAWVESEPSLIGAHGPEYALTLSERLLLAGRVPWFYACKAIWPLNLMFVYPRWTIDAGQWWPYMFPTALLLVALSLAWVARKHRGPLASFLIFVGMLFPVLGFFNVYPFRYSFVADHFQYLAILAVITPAAWAISTLVNRTTSNRLASIVVAAFIVAPLAALTWQQSGDYVDYETLFRRTLARNPDSALVHNNLGVMLMSTGREAEALPHMEAAVRLAPRRSDFRVNLGLALAQAPGRLHDAIAEYESVLRTDPYSYSAHLNLGLALMSIPGRQQDAVAEYQKAIEATKATMGAGSEFWQAHLNLGIAYAQLPGRQAEAINELHKALQMKPDSALAHFHLGNTFHKVGRLEDAIAEYQESLRLDPNVPEVHYELAYALARIPGRVPEAIAACRRMLILKPGDAAGKQLMASLIDFQNNSRR
ncbi:MAG TPA: tetratricopeptide repeat protein [Bryobacteraceae bacterium]|nr:tetratricopeptide repeat protein [Bryobacteraceae bacterium]